MKLDTFLEVYKQLNGDNLELLEKIYAEDIVFTDPAHAIHGLEKLTNYFSSLYQNITSIDFSFGNRICVDGEAYLQWDMRFSHPKLKKGDSITLPGITYLRFNEDGKISHHRDYFDLGCMLYEHIPLLGKVVTSIKRRLGQ